MTKTDCINILREEYDRALQAITKENQDYYHIHSLENFIIHFDKLPDENIFQVFEGLMEYIKIIKGKKQHLAMYDSKELFNDYIKPMWNNYYLKIGFTADISILTRVILLIVIFSIFYFFQVASFFYVLISIIAILYSLRIFKKRKKHMTIFPPKHNYF
jgi:hypothetical protein